MRSLRLKFSNPSFRFTHHLYCSTCSNGRRDIFRPSSPQGSDHTRAIVSSAAVVCPLIRRRINTFVHHPAFRQIQILAVLNDGHIEHLCVFGRQRLAIHNGLSIVGNTDNPGLEHLTYFRERFALLFFRNRTDRKHVSRRSFCLRNV